jgi:hypothetical protein
MFLATTETTPCSELGEISEPYPEDHPGGQQRQNVHTHVMRYRKKILTAVMSHRTGKREGILQAIAEISGDILHFFQPLDIQYPRRSS